MRRADHSVVPWRKRLDPLTDSHQALRLRREYRNPLLISAKIQRPDPDRIPRRDILFSLCIVQNQCILRIQESEHIDSVLLIERQQDLTVGVAHESITFLDQPLLNLAESIELTVADHRVPIQSKRLHPCRGQTHDSKPVKAQKSVPGIQDPAVIRSS